MYLGAGSPIAFFFLFAALMAPRYRRDKDMSDNKAIKKTNQGFSHGRRRPFTITVTVIYSKLKKLLSYPFQNANLSGS
jgi:hypothetical protein